MATRFIGKGRYLVTIRHRDGGAFQKVVQARGHAEAARQCLQQLALIWGA